MRAAAVVLAALVAAWWVIAPLTTPPPARSLGLPAAAAVKLFDRPTGPILYAYQRECVGEEESCERWHLVGTDGRRWWIPDNTGRTDLVLSPDGTRTAHYRTLTKEVVVLNLITGARRSFPGKADRLALTATHLAVQSGKTLTTHDLASGKQTVSTEKGKLRGVTADGFVLTDERPDDTTPGHVSAANLTVIRSAGKKIHEIPANLLTGLALSPDGTTLATAPAAGLALVDVATGKVTKTLAVPALEKVVRWLDGAHVIVTTANPPGGYGSLTAYQVLDLTTATLRPLNVNDTDAIPTSVSVGSVG